jgi:hypothetical protein
MDDAPELLELLQDQKALLRRVLAPARDRFERASQNMDIALFCLAHGWNVCEMAKAATLLMEAGEPFALPLLARSALESSFNLLAAVRSKPFAPQKIAHEWEELAGKFEFFIKSGCWDSSRRPTPEQCRQTADRVRKHYAVEPKSWKQTEQIAERAELSPYYDDDYRFLSLHVHANQIGILNTATGFLSRKAGLALANALFLTTNALVGVSALGDQFDTELAGIRARMDTLMKRPDLLPPWPNDPADS